MKLRFAALRVEQRLESPLFIFGVDGHVIPRFAAVNAAERAQDGTLMGYQREEVVAHIRQIAAYLARDEAILPNAIVVAFSHGLDFTPAPGSVHSHWGTPGTLSILVPGSSMPKPGLIVDGQQRVSALSLLPHNRKFPVVVVGFAAESAALQREQFVLLNKTKPLPRGLLNELLPHIDTELPVSWQRRRVSGTVAESLRFDPTSPFYGRVRGIGTGGDGANISLAAVMEVVQGSVRALGALSPILANTDERLGVSQAAKVMSVFFSAVARVWPHEWAGSPRTSRLVHGVGIVAMGRLMDLIMQEVDASRPRAIHSVERRLRTIEERCAWMDGDWPPPLSCPWNSLQNTSQDKRRLGEFLISAYEDANNR